MKASTKQFGKFSQFLGEKLGREKASAPSEEFLELERDIELRKAGIDRLDSLTSNYVHHISKRKEHKEAGVGKALPIEALGVVMLGHGDEFGPDSAYGQSLVSAGRALCKIAGAQEALVRRLEDGWAAGIEKAVHSIREYESLRKKLESRRLAYDAAYSRSLKASKKDVAAAEEVMLAKDRYDETSTEIQIKMHGIQEAELDHLKDLTSFVDAHIAFADEYKAIMKELKADWVDETAIRRIDVAIARPAAPTHKRAPSRPTTPRATSGAGASSDEDEPSGVTAPAKSVENRKRSDSAATAKAPSGSMFGKLITPGSSVRGAWGSLSKRSGAAAVGLSSNGPSSKYADLDAGGNEPPSPSSALSPVPSASTNTTSSSFATAPPPPPMRRAYTAPAVPQPKVVRALYDYAAGGTDELSLRVGGLVTVTAEPSEGWWIGEDHKGNRGMFPAAYTEPFSGPASVAAQSPPPRQSVESARSPFDGQSSETDDEHPSDPFAYAESDSSETEALRPALQHAQPPPSSSSSGAVPPPPAPRRGHSGSVSGGSALLSPIAAAKNKLSRGRSGSGSGRDGDDGGGLLR